MTKEEALKKIEELKKYVADEEVKEAKCYIIRNKYNDSEIYVSTKDNVRDAVIEAMSKGVNLFGAYLSKANLSKADLFGANLSKSNLFGADLSGADLGNAKFYGKGGTIKLKKNQVEDFLNALGFQIEN